MIGPAPENTNDMIIMKNDHIIKLKVHLFVVNISLNQTEVS